MHPHALFRISGDRLCYRPGGYDKDNTVSRIPVPLNKWTHVAATYDGETARVFIDGKLAGERKLNVPMPTLGGTYQLGRSGHGYPFIGLVRDVKVSNYCKTDLDVR